MPRFEPLPERRPAIVAGASSGIGAATATELAAHGFPVALGSRRVDKCQELVDEIRSSGGEAVALPLDVTDPEPLPDGAMQPDQAVLATTIVEARRAELAAAAGEQRLDRGAIADPPPGDALAHRVDHADVLVAERHAGAHAIGVGV